MTEADLDGTGGDDVSRALALGQDDDGYWRIVKEFRQRGGAQALRLAALLVGRESADERLLGIDLIAQMDVDLSDRPTSDQVIDLLLPLAASEPQEEVLSGVVWPLSVGREGYER